MDLLDLFDRGTSWAGGKIPVASRDFSAPTPCDDWNVRALLNHMLHVQQLFTQAASGQPLNPPQGMPPEIVSDDVPAQYEEARQGILAAYGASGTIESTGPALGIAFVDQLVHGWDLARASGQEAIMPEDLAQPAFAMVDGRLTDDRRGSAFKAAVPVPESSKAQDRLVGYTGRQP